jgi:hypothetical protein
MAIGKEKSSSSVFLDTSSAQFALDKLNKKIDEYDRKLKQTNLSQREIISLQKERAIAAEKAAKVQLQIENGIGATLVQQKKYVQDLTKEISNLAVGTQEWIDKKKQLDAANDTLAEMKERLNDVSDAQNKVSKISNVMASFFGNILANVALRAAGAVKSFFVDSFDEALEAEEKTARLKATLENLGKTDVFDRMIAKAEEMAQRFTFLDNDDVVGVFKQLIDYGKLTEKQMNDLLPVIVNFAANSRISVQESTSVILKALEGNGKGLKEYGINIKNAKTETDRLNIVMTTLADKVEGAGDAFENTAAGSIASTKQQVKELKEEIGTGLLPILAKLLTFANNAIKGLNSFIGAVSAEFKSGTGNAAFLISTFKDNKDVQTEIETSERLFISNHQTNLKTLDELHKKGQKLNFTEKDIIEETIKNLKQVKQDADNALVIASKKTNVKFDELASVFVRQQAAQKAIDQLEANASGVIGTGGTPEIDPNAESKFNSLLQKAAEFNKRIRDLQQQSQDASLTQNQKEIDDAKHKYDEILIAYRALVKELDKNGIKLDFNEDDIKKLEDNELAGIIEKQRKEFLDKQAKDYIASAEKEYQESLRNSANSFEALKQQRAQAFTQGLIDEKQFKADVAAIDAAASQNQLQIASEYAGKKVSITVDGVQKEVALVKQADEDLTKFKKDNLEKQTADILASYAQRKENLKLLKDLDQQAELSTLQARVATAHQGSQEELEAKKALLAAEHRIEIEALEERRKQTIISLESQFDTELKLIKQQIEVKRKIELALVDENDPEAEKKKAAINERFNNAQGAAEVESTNRKNETLARINNDFNALIQSANDIFRKKDEDSTIEHYGKIAESVLQFGQQVLSIFSSINEKKTQQENDELARIQKNNDKQKASYSRLLNGKLISQQEYNRKIKAIDDEYNARVAAAKRKQWERQHKADESQAIIGGAQAVLNGLQTKPFLPLGIIMGGLAGVLAGIQIANVFNEDTPEFKKGTILHGPAHKDGGIDMIDSSTGRKVAEAEGGELLLSKEFVKKNPELSQDLLEASQKNNGELNNVPSKDSLPVVQDPSNKSEQPTFNTGIAAAKNIIEDAGVSDNTIKNAIDASYRDNPSPKFENGTIINQSSTSTDDENISNKKITHKVVKEQTEISVSKQVNKTVDITEASSGSIDKKEDQPHGSPQYAKGTILNGPSHKEGGIEMIDSNTGKKVAEAEGGELMLSKNFVKKNPDLSRQLLHASQRNNGTLEPFWKNRPFKQIDVIGISRSIQRVRHFESGGILQPADQLPGVKSGNQSQSQQDQLTAAGQQNVVNTTDMESTRQVLEMQVAVINDLQRTIIQLNEKLDKPFKSYVSNKDIATAKEIEERILADAIFK